MDSTDEVYQGLDCIRISNETVSVWITKNVGLRIIGLSINDHDDLLAFLPNARIELPGGEDYHLRGGHRLWYAPEKPETTYIPDNQPVETIVREGSVEQIQPVDGSTGIQKSWEIKMGKQNSQVIINHRLSNLGENPILLAPWAITMLRPGGVGIFPQHSNPSDENGLLPNRHLVFWPYTQVVSPYILLRDEAIFMEAKMKSDALKIGFPNPDGWLAYSINDLLFVKKAAFDQGAEYLDRGASSEVYCCAEFIELETLGPAVNLAPREIVKHQEVWEIYTEGNWLEDILDLYQMYQLAEPGSHSRSKTPRQHFGL